MAKYGISDAEIQRKGHETEQEFNKRMYDLTCKFYNYIGF